MLMIIKIGVNIRMYFGSQFLVKNQFLTKNCDPTFYDAKIHSNIHPNFDYHKHSRTYLVLGAKKKVLKNSKKSYPEDTFEYLSG